MSKIYNFNRLVNKYSNDIKVKTFDKGRYVNGRYVPGETSKTTVRGAVIPYSTRKKTRMYKSFAGTNAKQRM